MWHDSIPVGLKVEPVKNLQGISAFFANRSRGIFERHRTIRELVGLGDFSKYALMSRMLLTIRTAFVIFVALLQLMIQPATQVVHLGCHHAGSRVPAGDTAIVGGAERGSGSCRVSHCCSHCVQHSTNASRETGQDRSPVPSHDEDECQICQVVSAARMSAGIACVLASVEPVCEYEAPALQCPCEAPRYSVLSRGPPAMVA